MDCSDVDGIKKDLSITGNNIFESFEPHNNGLTTMEEVRSIFASQTEHYIGPMDQLSVEGITNLFNKHQAREQKLWRVAIGLEAEQRFLRAQQ